MKKFTKVFSLILMAFLTFTLAGCNAKDNDEIEAQNAIKDFLNIYYTVDKNDIESYKIITFGFKPEERKNWDDEYEKNLERFKPLLTDKAYKELIATRMSYGRIREPYDKKVYVTVKDIKLEKYYEENDENKEQSMLVYYYDIELTETPISGNEIKSVNEKKQITVLKIDDSWKVDYIDIR